MVGRLLTPEDLLNVVSIGSPALSSAGTLVAFLSRETVAAKNHYAFTLSVLEISDPERKIDILSGVNDGAGWEAPFSFQWAPDSNVLLVLQRGQSKFLRFNLDEIQGREVRPEAIHEFDKERVGTISSFAISPDGGSVAVLASQTQRPEPPTEAVEIDILKCGVLDLYNQKLIEAQRPKPMPSLWVFESRTGDVNRLTEDVFVNSYCWSKDSLRLLVLAGADTNSHDWSTASFLVIDRATGASKPLDRGLEEAAAWVTSPDGKWFATYPLTRTWHFCPPKLIAAEGLESDFQSISRRNASGPFWSKDSRQHFFGASYRMESHLFRISPHAAPKQMTSEGWNSGFTSNGEVVAFTNESVTQPPELYVAPLNQFEPRRLTISNPAFDEISQPMVERLRWRSSDDRWDIDAYLIFPINYTEDENYPLLVEVIGGPTMVMMSFVGGFHFSPLLFAANGYAVLVPNTRGRHGGYEEDFCNAMAAEGNQCAGAFSDVMAGIDLLVDRGVADPDRLGIMGHSYGAVLTAFAITQTDRFKAASFHEGAVDLVRRMFMDGGNPKTMEFLHQIWGYGSPYDSEELEQIRRDSALYHIHKARTPVLVEAGEVSGIAVESAVLAHGLARNGVPFEFRINPGTGHVVTQPQLADAARRRNLAWFDYWLQDKPYTDPEKQARYDQWKATTERMV